jgi:hypothetical protein
MKARVAKETELILWHGFDPDTERGCTFLKVLERLSIPQRKVENWMWDQMMFHCLEEKVEIPLKVQETNSIPSEEMIVLKGIQGARLDELLHTLKQEGVSPIALKAVVTPYNRRWTLRHLYEELCKEKQALQ